MSYTPCMLRKVTVSLLGCLTKVSKELTSKLFIIKNKIWDKHMLIPKSKRKVIG